jgi:hypothetical protein
MSLRRGPLKRTLQQGPSSLYCVVFLVVPLFSLGFKRAFETCSGIELAEKSHRECGCRLRRGVAKQGKEQLL